MRKRFLIPIEVLLAACLCGCAENISEISKAVSSDTVVTESLFDEASHVSTKWTPVEVSDDDISCEGLALTALNSGNFPEMVKATDSTLLDTIMDFSQYGITDYCVYQQAISVELSEVIVVRAEDSEGAYSALMNRKNSLIKQFGAYPEQAKTAGQTVVFKKGNVCALIASDSPLEAEKALLAKLKANGTAVSEASK